VSDGGRRKSRTDRFCSGIVVDGVLDTMLRFRDLSKQEVRDVLAELIPDG
jgi:hypothetical protein